MAVPDLRSYVEQLARLHPRLCPRQVLGVRMGLCAGEELGLALPRADKRLLALVETDGCFADGVSVATGCWLGRRTLRLVDYGRVAATVVDSATERAVRICPHPSARIRAGAWAPDAPNCWHAQLAGYQRMPDAELLCVERVVLELPLLRFLIGEAGTRVSCTLCGEEILNAREIPGASGPICRSCAVEPYYRVTESNVSIPRMAKHPHARDVPGQDVTLTGNNVWSRKPLAPFPFLTETGAYKPFGVPAQKGEVVKGGAVVQHLHHALTLGWQRAGAAGVGRAQSRTAWPSARTGTCMCPTTTSRRRASAPSPKTRTASGGSTRPGCHTGP
jgi:formylmethanofuran dehydrogenase subunit E